jgi:hypothetical protein
MKKLIMIIVLALGLFSPVLIPAAAYAEDCPGGSRGEVLEGIGESGSGCKEDTQIGTTINAVVSIISIIAGIVAVIMIILAGFKYITSAGDTGKVSSAKTSLIYALVGVAIVALAQFLVHFVITNTANPAPAKPSAAATPAGSKQSGTIGEETGGSGGINP